MMVGPLDVVDSAVEPKVEEELALLGEIDDTKQLRLRFVRTLDVSSKSPELIDLKDPSETPQLVTHDIKLDHDFLWTQLDSVSDEVIQDYSNSDFVAGSGMVISSTVIAGYVLWTMRASYALAWFSSAVPMWSHFDPLPILNSVADGGLGDSESLEDIVGH